MTFFKLLRVGNFNRSRVLFSFLYFGNKMTNQELADSYEEGVKSGKAFAMDTLKSVLQEMKTKDPQNSTQTIFNNILDEIWKKVEVEVF